MCIKIQYIYRSYLRNDRKGCLVLDKHGVKKSNFIETSCERKRSFICMISEFEF